MRAAEHPPAGLDAMADDLAPAVLAHGSHGVDRALERVERVRLAPALDRHRLFLLVAADLACRHEARATRAGAESLDAAEARVRVLAAPDLRHGAAVHAHDVGREVVRAAQQRRPDAIGVDGRTRRLERGDLRRVEAARDDDPRMLVALG